MLTGAKVKLCPAGKSTKEERNRQTWPRMHKEVVAPGSNHNILLLGELHTNDKGAANSGNRRKLPAFLLADGNSGV
jgi:hypothetical protein